MIIEGGAVITDTNIKNYPEPLRGDSTDDLDRPNKETVEAMQEAEQIARNPRIPHYADVEEALRELKR